MRVLIISLVTCLLATAATANSAFAQFENLVRRIPDKANTLVLINVAEALKSPMATKEGWRARLEKEFAAGMTVLSPTADVFVMASDLDFEMMKPNWQVSLMDLTYEPNLTKVAAELGGQMDTISGQPTVMLPSDYCLVKFGTRVAALIVPANRQNVGRWVNRVNDDSILPLSKFLQGAVKFAEEGAPIIMALDLKHAFAPALIKERLATFKALKGREKDIEAIATKLSSIEGVMLGITLLDRRYGSIKIDFAEDVSALGALAKPILLEVLERQGAMINEFETWDCEVKGNQIRLSGYLYESGMQRIMSIVDMPPSLQPPPSSSRSAADTEDSLVALSTQEYFQNVQKLLDDLTSKRKSTEFVTWGQVGMWFEKYARKIERMPLNNVDPQLLDWGAYVSNALRDAESAMKGIGSRSAVRQSNLGNSTSSYTSYRGVGVTRRGGAGFYNTWSGETRDDLKLKSQARARVRTQESIRGNTNANLIMQGLEHSMLDIRRSMTKKYPDYKF